jgi:hypothetical protein
MYDDIEVLARLVDERIGALPEGLDPARLFGVRLRDEGFVLVPFWSGVAREIPYALRPPDGCVAIALDTGGWSAPLDDCDIMRPSEHPSRRRIHTTTLIHGDGEDVTVLTYDGDSNLQVMRGGVGVVPERMRAVWSRRRQPA